MATKHNAIRNEQTFLAWLQDDASSPDELLAWLSFGFRRGPEQEEPHQQLFSSLPQGGNRYPLIKRLAVLVSAILDRHPNLAIPFRNQPEAPPEFVSRLLSFAALLDCPSELAEPLFRVRTALLSATVPLVRSVQVALTEAILHNQNYHSQLLDIWLHMTAGQPDPVLGGVRETGMEGIAMMPGERGDQPDRNAVGQGLLQLAESYAPDPKTRRQRFRIQDLRVKNLWALPGEYFIRLAHDFKWVENGHGWAVDALPELFASNFGEVGQGSEHGALVWHWFVRCLEPWGVLTVKDRSLCGGRVWEVRFSPDISQQLDMIILAIKRLAGNELLNSEHEANCYIQELMARLAQHAHHSHHRARAATLEETRRVFCQEARLTCA
jgi:hypothetical protein